MGQAEGEPTGRSHETGEGHSKLETVPECEDQDQGEEGEEVEHTSTTTSGSPEQQEAKNTKSAGFLRSIFGMTKGGKQDVQPTEKQRIGVSLEKAHGASLDKMAQHLATGHQHEGIVNKVKLQTGGHVGHSHHGSSGHCGKSACGKSTALQRILADDSTIEKLNKRVAELTAKFDKERRAKESLEDEVSDVREEYEERLEASEQTRELLCKQLAENEKSMKDKAELLRDAELYKTKAYTLEQEKRIWDMEHEQETRELKDEVQALQDKIQEAMMTRGSNKAELIPLNSDERKTLSGFNPMRLWDSMKSSMKKSSQESEGKEADLRMPPSAPAQNEKEFQEWQKKFEGKYNQLHTLFLSEMQENREMRSKQLFNVAMNRSDSVTSNGSDTPSSCSKSASAYRHNKKQLVDLMGSQRTMRIQIAEKDKKLRRLESKIKTMMDTSKYDKALKKGYQEQIIQMENSITDHLSKRTLMEEKHREELEAKDRELEKARQALVMFQKKLEQANKAKLMANRQMKRNGGKKRSTIPV